MTTENDRSTKKASSLHSLIRALAWPVDFLAAAPAGWKAFVVVYLGIFFFFNATVAFFGPAWVPRALKWLIENAP